MNHDKSGNSHLIPLELSEELKNEEIITRFEKDMRTNSLILSLNHKYKKKCFIFPIPTKRIDWIDIIAKIAKALKAFGMSPGHMLMIEDVMHDNYEIVIGIDTSDQQNPENGKKKEICYVHKYTANGSLPLHKSPTGVFHESNSQFSATQGQNAVQEPTPEPGADQFVNTANVDHGDTATTSNTNNNNKDIDNDNITAAVLANQFYNNNYNLKEIHSKENSLSNLTSSSPITETNLLLLPDHQTTQIKLYSKMPYRHLKCDACDASDATDATRKRTDTNNNKKTKAEEVGLPEIPCLYCDFKDPIEFDLKSSLFGETPMESNQVAHW